MIRPAHLIRRYRRALVAKSPSIDDLRRVESILTSIQFGLWLRMPVADQAHSIDVSRSFLNLRPDAPVEEFQGVLLHDVGKIESALGIHARVVATLIGPRTRRFRLYHEHESLGARLLQASGCSGLAVDIVAGKAPTNVMEALAAADEI